MRIAMIGHKTFPSRIGGVEVVVCELARRLTEADHHVTVYNRGSERKEKHYFDGKVEVYNTWPNKMEGLGAAVSSWIASLSLPFHDYDVVHYHALGPSVTLFLAKLFGKKTVATVHGLDWQRSKWGKLARTYLKLGERMIVWCADAVITLSEPDHAYFLKKYHKQTHLIENAITPVEPLEPKQITEQFGLKKYDYILYLGRIDRVKGIPYLIEAYNCLKTDKKLVIAGNLKKDEYSDFIRQMAEGNENILLVGQVEGDLQREMFSNASFYVLPSELEGLPLSLLEAMSSGTRCLASDIPGNLSVLGAFGASFVSKDVSSLTDAMRTLLSRPDENPERERQMAYIRGRYHYDRVIRETEKVYRDVVQARKPKN